MQSRVQKKKLKSAHILDQHFADLVFKPTRVQMKGPWVECVCVRIESHFGDII